jgi:hypothetical protein
VLTLNKTWLLAPALLLSLTAVFRVLAWALHDASFAATQIAVEVVVAGLLLYAAAKTSEARV